MSKKPKPLLIIGAVICLSVASTMTAFAGWEQTGTTWKYQNSDKTYLTNTWSWIDGNGDGIAECYYFNADGIMLANTTTPDSFTVNEQGAWVVNGEVQTEKGLASIPTDTATSEPEKAQTNQTNQNQTNESNSKTGGKRQTVEEWYKDHPDASHGTGIGHGANWDF